MDTNLYTFSKQSESMLKQFEKACEDNITPINKWNTHFNNKMLLKSREKLNGIIFPYNDLPTNLSFEDFIRITQTAPQKSVSDIHEDVIEIETNKMDVDVSQCDITNLNITTSDNSNILDKNTNSKFNIKHLLETVESEANLGPIFVENLMEKCLLNEEIFESILTSISDVAMERLCTSILNFRPNSIFLKVFFEKFLIRAIRMKNSRSLDNCILISFRYSHDDFSRYFLIQWLSDKQISVDTFKTFVTSLTEIEKSYILNEILKNDFDDINFNEYLSVIHILYESCDVNENVQGNMVRLLSSNNNLIRDKTYGKLLLIVIKHTEPVWCSIIETLNYLVDMNDSVIKKPCQNALNKLIP